MNSKTQRDEKQPVTTTLSRRSLLTVGSAAVLLPTANSLSQVGPPPAATSGAPAGVPANARAPRPTLTAVNAETVLKKRWASLTCTVATQMVEGPYYIDNRLLRSDIRDGQPGQKITLKLAVVDTNSLCDPVKGALISVWQANVDGMYSGYPDVVPDRLQPSSGRPLLKGHAPETGKERFLRGVQTTDAEGMVTFTTIVPGWYTMRAPHIHVRVFLNEHEMATTQLFLPQVYINNVYAKPPYVKRGPGIIANDNDLIRAQSNAASWSTLELSEEGDDIIAFARIGLSHA